MEIKLEVLQKYNLGSLEVLKEHHGDSINTEIMFYKEFLNQTDHIPNKIIEAQILNRDADDYTEILEYRQYARDKINSLMTQSDNVEEE